MEFQKYSVLMSVYQGENPKFFKQSIESICRQTVKAEQIVIVCDGPLTKELDEILAYYKKSFDDVFTICRLKQNRGTGYAANEGLAACRNELIAKMDSDDIAYAHRCERQVAAFQNEPSLDMLGGFVSEFEKDIHNVMAVKKVPFCHEEIVQYAKRRNPFNNQTLMYKKSKALACGGYTCNTRCEDYDFIVKMILCGAKCKNLQESLVYYRLDGGAYDRRRNFKNTKGFIAVRFKNWRRGFCSFFDFLLPCIVQIILFLLPVCVTKKIYLYILRK